MWLPGWQGVCCGFVRLGLPFDFLMAGSSFLHSLILFRGSALVSFRVVSVSLEQFENGAVYLSSGSEFCWRF